MTDADQRSTVTPLDPRRTARAAARRADHAAWAADPRSAPTKLSMDAAAAIAGVTRRSVDRWIAARLVRHYRPGDGGRILVDRDDLLRFLDEAAVEPVRSAAR